MTEKLTEIATKLNRESRFDDMPRLIFITDNKAQPHPEDVITRLPSGSMVILRDYDDDNRVEDDRNNAIHLEFHYFIKYYDWSNVCCFNFQYL